MRARRSPDYHLTKPWLLDQDLYRAVSEFLADWARDTEPGFQLFRVIGDEPDPGLARVARAADPVQRPVQLPIWLAANRAATC